MHCKGETRSYSPLVGASSRPLKLVAKATNKGNKLMKKLMFAIAAVAAGAVFAEEAPAVASANIVG